MKTLVKSKHSTKRKSYEKSKKSENPVISSNIKHLRDVKNLSQEKLADDLKITQSRLGAYEEKRSEPPIEILIKLSDYFHISIDIMIRVDLRKTNINSIMKLGSNRILFPMVIDKENNDRIEVVTASASAGYLTGYADPEYFEKLPYMELPFQLTGKHRAFPIKGDSMPPLETGDIVVGKYVESLKAVVNGKSYILITANDGIVYKRIYKKSNTVFELHSDNPAYLPYVVKYSEILELWEYNCSIKKSDSKNEEANMENIMKVMLQLKGEIEHLKNK